MIDGPIPEALTFDDVLLLPGKSSILPTEVDPTTKFTRKLALNIPLASAAMDTVTESRLAIGIAARAASASSTAISPSTASSKKSIASSAPNPA